MNCIVHMVFSSYCGQSLSMSNIRLFIGINSKINSRSVVIHIKIIILSKVIYRAVKQRIIWPVLKYKTTQTHYSHKDKRQI